MTISQRTIITTDPSMARLQLLAWAEEMESRHAPHCDPAWRDGTESQEWVILARRLKSALERKHYGGGINA